MKLLDYERFETFLKVNFSDNESINSRRVGRGNEWISPYVAIHRFFGDCAVDPALITVRRDSRSFACSDDRIIKYVLEISEFLRSSGKLFDGPPATHVVRESLTASDLHMVIQRCDYALQAGSCFALDLVHPFFANSGGSLRDYYYEKRQKLGKNPLPQCLGVCGMLVAKDGDSRSVLVTQRSAAVASYENSIGPSVAGSVDFPERDSTLADLLVNSLARETVEELGLDERDFKITPLAIARELYRGERPQLFGLIETLLPMKSVLESVKKNQSLEISECIACKIEGSTLPQECVSMFNPEAKMAWYLCEEFLSCEIR